MAEKSRTNEPIQQTEFTETRVDAALETVHEMELRHCLRHYASKRLSRGISLAQIGCEIESVRAMMTEEECREYERTPNDSWMLLFVGPRVDLAPVAEQLMEEFGGDSTD